MFKLEFSTWITISMLVHMRAQWINSSHSTSNIKRDIFFLFGTLHLASIKSIWLNRLCKRTIMNKQLVLMHNIFDIIESKAQGLTFFIVSDIVGNQYSKRNYVNWRKNWWTEGKLTKCLEFMSLLCVEMYKMQVQMGTK